MSPEAIAEVLEASLSDASGMQRVPYTLDVKRSRFSWGADASAASVVIQVGLAAAGYVAGAAKRRLGKGADEALDGAITRIMDVVRRDPFEPAQLDRDEAIQRAEWQLRATFDIGESVELRIGFEERQLDSGSWSIGFIDGDGARFEVELEQQGGLVQVIRVRREMAEDRDDAK
jgi:hypothetical protein